MAMDEGSQMPPEDSGAGDQLAAPPQVGDSASKTITVPADLMPNCKVGDSYTVKSMEGDNVTLEMTPGEDTGDDWGEGLKAAAPRGEM